MKKILIAAAMAIVSVEAIQAGSFGLFTCKSCNSCNFVVRPYNAFSPVCSGTIFCDGAMPISSNGMNGGCASLNYTDGAPLPMGPGAAPRKGAYMFMPGSPTNFAPVYMQQGYPVPYQVMPYPGLPFQQIPQE